MARNVEIKARVDDLACVKARVASIASDGPVTLSQDDTFFRCSAGRLKLREFGDGTGELIFYQRCDEPGPKESFYIRSVTSTPSELRQSLAFAYGEAGRVVKRRTLYLVGRTRVHLDEVEGLGEFVELEVVLRACEPVSVGTLEAQQLMDRLGIRAEHLLTGAYVDLAGLRRASGIG